MRAPRLALLAVALPVLTLATAASGAVCTATICVDLPGSVTIPPPGDGDPGGQICVYENDEPPSDWNAEKDPVPVPPLPLPYVFLRTKAWGNMTAHKDDWDKRGCPPQCTIQTGLTLAISPSGGISGEPTGIVDPQVTCETEVGP